MAYVNDPESIERQTDAILRLNEAFIRSNGVLRITLSDGRTIAGRYYGAHCSANDASKLSCCVELGDEDDEYPGIYDVLNIVAVEAVSSN